ncbi:MAG: hypothetical protein U0793_14280 [Gemmataceae bacterium]
MKRYAIPALCFVALALAGCGGQEEKKSPTPAAGGKYVLDKEPEGAQGVLAVKAKAKDGDEIAVVGRVGGSEKPLIKGRSAFTIVDTSFKSCADREGDTCPTPWDYCCEPAGELKKGTLLVKIVDDKGESFPMDAHDLAGVDTLQTVVVKGTFKRDGDAVVLLTKAIFIRK